MFAAERGAQERTLDGAQPSALPDVGKAAVARATVRVVAPDQERLVAPALDAQSGLGKGGVGEGRAGCAECVERLADGRREDEPGRPQTRGVEREAIRGDGSGGV
jgi:hypothetical protein